MNDENYRHELKFSIDRGTYLALRQRLRCVMRLDAHTGESGVYTVRSIYFDNINDKALREKTDGAQTREKFRIRYYNDDFSFITLEKKIKHNSLTMKRGAVISENECRALLGGDYDWMRDSPAPLVNELYFRMRSGTLRPRVLVSYIREPYVYPAGNVRVTFDFNVSTSLWQRAFLTANQNAISAFDSPDDMILEVKYDAFLPEIISDLLQCGALRQSAFSKYAASRRFG